MASCYNEQVISLIDARRGYVYAGVYDKDLNAIYEDRYIFFDTSGLNGKFVSFDEFAFATCEPKIDLIKIINKHEHDTEVNPHMLNPNYLKLTEAEENRLNDQRS